RPPASSLKPQASSLQPPASSLKPQAFRLTPMTAELPASAVAPRAADYWQQARRPLASLAFILPLLALYEGGVLALGSAAIRNGVDIWLRRLLDLFGLGHYFLLPVLIVCLLLSWHHV